METDVAVAPTLAAVPVMSTAGPATDAVVSLPVAELTKMTGNTAI